MSETLVSIKFLEHFESLDDPRQPWKVLYPLSEILLLCLCAVISGAEGWKDIAEYGHCKLSFLPQFSDFNRGTPSEDTLSEVFSKLNPRVFQECFAQWTQSLRKHVSQQMIAIDGKTSRHSFDTAIGQSPLQMVSAWASHQEVVMAQEAVAGKSNEIKAIPHLLDMLVLKGAIVSIDAMGCQKTIAQDIIQRKADYVLALKANHKELLEDVEHFFEQQRKEHFRHSQVDQYQSIGKEHGRIETRQYWSCGDVNWIGQQHPGWTSLKSIIMVESQRHLNGKTSTEKRYYLSSLTQDAQLAAQAIRGHWGIENKLHWVLDVVFREDDSRIRKNHAPRNFSVIRQIALNLIRQKKGKQSVRGFRKIAGWVEQTLLETLLHT